MPACSGSLYVEIGGLKIWQVYYEEHVQSKMLRFKLVPYSKVLNLLNSLSKSKATGLDKISGKILKAAASSIASSLTYIFNHALISSHFPSEWKVARLLPLFKKGPRNLAENYRPCKFQFCHQ
jgi:hypothetical protein